MNIPENASKEQLDQLRKIWKEHGHYNTKETMITEKNTAKTIINDKIEMTNEVRVDIELPKEKWRYTGSFDQGKRQNNMNIRQKMRSPIR